MPRNRKPKPLDWDAALRLAVTSQAAAIKLEQDCKRVEEFILRQHGNQDLHFAHMDCAAAAGYAHLADILLKRVIEELGK